MNKKSPLIVSISIAVLTFVIVCVLVSVIRISPIQSGILMGIGLVIINYSGFNIKIAEKKYGLSCRDIVEFFLWLSILLIPKISTFQDQALIFTTALTLRGFGMSFLKTLLLDQYFTSIENQEIFKPNEKKDNATGLKIQILVKNYIAKKYHLFFKK